MSSFQALKHIDRARLGAIARLARDMVLDAVYPPRCLACPEPTEAAHGLCAACWRDTHFIAGASCRICGAPIPGEDGAVGVCDACLQRPPAWDRGAAAVIYGGAARRVVLALKHGDRLDMVKPITGWMAVAGAELLRDADVIAPVPLHWRRLIKRKYNQSAELARALSRRTGKPTMGDLLVRARATPPQEKMDFEARRNNQSGAFAVSPRRLEQVQGQNVLLVDDVLTSGATLSSCAEALREAGAKRISVLVVARAATDREWRDSPRAGSQNETKVIPRHSHPAA